jgi:hypothetical protein
MVYVYVPWYGYTCSTMVRTYYKGPAPPPTPGQEGVMQALVRIQAYLLAHIVVVRR